MKHDELKPEHRVILIKNGFTEQQIEKAYVAAVGPKIVCEIYKADCMRVWGG